ncbi:MAG: precorrin-2 C(20)-methyltransferase [Thermodesulfobacteria bacterium]|nr:precorrin-2 C(20)-methyltransferase [Thermodesulfobacteriota bacterium]
MKLFGIGVGPGDPELLTIKAVKALRSSHHIFTASSTKNEYSLALKVAREYIPPSVTVEALGFPMTKDPAELKKAWKKNALRVFEVLKRVKVASFITLGDPTLFSTFGYLARELKDIAPEVEIELIPGITAAQAAASKLGLSLAEGSKGFAIVSATSPELLKKLLELKDLSLAVYKVYKNKETIIDLVERAGRNPNYVVIKCGFPEEKIMKDIKHLKKEKPSYFTLLLTGVNSINHEEEVGGEKNP